MKNIFFYTQGCRLNQAESSEIIEKLKLSGNTFTKYPEKADIAILNTCTVTKKADADSRRLINKLVKKNKNIEIAIIGCLAQIEKDKLFKFPNVKWIIGNSDKLNLEYILTNKHNIALVNNLKTTSFEMNSDISPNVDKTRVNLKIQDGCNNYCSYCIVPFARGRARSRIFENIIQQIEIYIENGFKEIILTGINIGKYNYKNKYIEDILKILKNYKTKARFRISSIEPLSVSDQLIDIVANNDFICKHLHIPLQSGSNDILKAMNRPYSKEFFQDLIWKIHKANPNITIGTDVIVGFPSEGEDDFEKTKNLIKILPINYLHVFSYSERAGTKSVSIKPKIPNFIMKKRSAILREISEEKKEILIKSFLNKKLKVLFEEEKNGLWMGFTDNYIKIMARSNQNLKNTFQLIQTKTLAKDGLFGEIL